MNILLILFVLSLLVESSLQTVDIDQDSIEIASLDDPRQKEITRLQEQIEKELEKDNTDDDGYDDRDKVNRIDQNVINQDYNQLDKIHQKLLDLEQMVDNDVQNGMSKEMKTYMNKKKKRSSSFDIFDSQMINRLMFRNIAFYSQNQKEIEYQFVLQPKQKKRLYKSIKQQNSSMFFMVYSVDQQHQNMNYSKQQLTLELKVSDINDDGNKNIQKCDKKFWGAMHCEMAVSNSTYQIEISNQAEIEQIVSLIGFKEYEDQSRKQQVENRNRDKEQQYREVYTQQMSRKDQLRIMAIIMRHTKNEMLRIRVQESMVNQYVEQVVKDNSRNKRRYLRYSIIEMGLYLLFMVLQIRFIHNVLANKSVI